MACRKTIQALTPSANNKEETWACTKTMQALREGLGGKMKDIVGKAGAGILQLKEIGFLEKTNTRLNEREIQMRLDDLDGLDDDDDDDEEDGDRDEEEDVSTETTVGRKRATTYNVRYRI
uniref:Uncharacterized protein n=1 Tax=Chaetoceros debilis TaxID=122233 RepID=A0A6S8WE05_9STRA